MIFIAFLRSPQSPSKKSKWFHSHIFRNIPGMLVCCNKAEVQWHLKSNSSIIPVIIFVSPITIKDWHAKLLEYFVLEKLSYNLEFKSPDVYFLKFSAKWFTILSYLNSKTAIPEKYNFQNFTIFDVTLFIDLYFGPDPLQNLEHLLFVKL